MSKSQIAAMIARRNAAKKNNAGRADPVLAACLDAAGFAEHRAY
jgi:hypothetical protein